MKRIVGKKTYSCQALTLHLRRSPLPAARASFSKSSMTNIRSFRGRGDGARRNARPRPDGTAPRGRPRDQHPEPQPERRHFARPRARSGNRMYAHGSPVTLAQHGERVPAGAPRHIGRAFSMSAAKIARAGSENVSPAAMGKMRSHYFPRQRGGASASRWLE